MTNKKDNHEYRFLLGAMAKTRWLVENNRHHRPDGAHDFYTLIARLRDYCQSDPFVDFDTQLNAISQFVKLSPTKILYLADAGEWLSLDRSTSEMEDDEYEEFWTDDNNYPRMNVYHHFMPQSYSEQDKYEIEFLNALYYGSAR